MHQHHRSLFFVRCFTRRKQKRRKTTVIFEFVTRENLHSRERRFRLKGRLTKVPFAQLIARQDSAAISNFLGARPLAANELLYFHYRLGIETSPLSKKRGDTHPIGRRQEIGRPFSQRALPVHQPIADLMPDHSITGRRDFSTVSHRETFNFRSTIKLKCNFLI